MAESAVFSILTKLAEPIFEKAVSLHGVSDDVDWLASEMRWMQSFLKDAETKRRSDRSNLINNWVRDVREVAQEGDDIIATFMLTIETRQQRQRRIGGLKGRIVRYAYLPLELKARHKVGVGIQKLRAKIQRIKASKDTYGLVDFGQTSAERPINDDLHKRRRIAPHLHNDNTTLIGFDAHKKTIIGQLLDTDIKQRCVVSIVGAGGIGKTTLATKIYNNSQIKSGFSVHACVSVSQTPQYDDMVRKIAKDILGVNQLQSMEMDDVERKVYEFLNGKRYLIILDDVWRVNIWDLMSKVLPDAKNGSRVLVTTRSMEVATSASTCIQPYELPLLDNKQSWDLFLNNAFPQNEDANPLSCPQALKEVGGKLVKKCGGMPLALVALGGLVSRKDPTFAEWAKVADRMDWTSTTEVGQNCINILALSYDDLPHHHLKSCFLYMAAIYPEDWQIRESQVVNLWVAEGLIPEASMRTMEETARSYLNELVARSMIQPHYKQPHYELFYNLHSELHPIYTVHDLFRDFCIKEARDEGFLGVYCPNSPPGGINLCRRLALHDLHLSTNQMNNWCPAPNLRSLLTFRTRFGNHQILNGLKLLRVIIHLGNYVSSNKLLERNSIHLRYLCVVGKFNKLRDLLPLYNLQTLDLSEAHELKRLPGSIGKMQMLRHFYLPNNCECPLDICNLKNLMTLHGAGAGGGWIEHGSEKLVNMEELIVYGKEVLLHSVGKMKRLTYLLLHFYEISTTVDSFICFSNLDQLVWMGLAGVIPEVRHLVFPPNLTTLNLQFSMLEQDLISVLEKLPNLTALTLGEYTFLGAVMICTTGGFPSLQQLVVRMLPGLEDWRVECGAMPKLNFLNISECETLAMLPEGLQHLTFLKRLEVHDNREEFRQRLKLEVGEDWYKIRHVPNIFVDEW